MPRATIAALTAAALLNGCTTTAHSETATTSSNKSDKASHQMVDSAGAHIISTKSINDFETTLTKLQRAIDSLSLIHI